jgi:hypothetical protein
MLEMVVISRREGTLGFVLYQYVIFLGILDTSQDVGVSLKPAYAFVSS